jgi:hypothetical protein
LDCKIELNKCIQAIEDLEKITNVMRKKTNCKLKGIEYALGNFHDRESEAIDGPLWKEIIRVKVCGGELWLWYIFLMNSFLGNLVKQILSH